MLRGWTTPSRYLSERKQAEMLVAVGVEARVIYSGPEQWPHFIRSLRPGDKAVVADLSIFASRKGLRDAVDEIEARQATLSTATPTDIDGPTLREVSKTESRWAGQRAMKSPAVARERARLGHIAYRKKLAASRLDEAVAKLIWQDVVRFPHERDALDNMPGWTRTTAWRRWGGRIPKPPGDDEAT